MTTRTPTWSDLDLLLFDGGWFVLDADNQRVAGVRPATLSKGLAMLGSGRVATVVGRLRPGVVAVDIDLTGERGHAVAELIAAWCRREGLWHVVRPSGGADGRTHIFTACGLRREHLEAHVDSLRSSFGVSARMIDVRDAIRPLSAPHRNGGHPAPLGDAAQALRLLRAALKALEAASRPVAAAPPSPTRAEPLQPRRQRRRRDLPPEWSRYLATGLRPPLSQNARDRSGSTYEHLATARMLQAGWTPIEAWSAISQAHPDAMPRARGSWTRWVRHVWNVAVAADDDYQHAPNAPTEVTASVEAARDSLRSLAWSTPPRARASLLTVGHVVLDRMERTARLRIPVPQRDLVLDTGISDRRVIATHLRAMSGVVGHLHEVFDPSHRDSSSFEFEIAQVGQVLETSPPRFHTPTPADLPAGLPRMTWPVLRSLPSAGGRLEDLAHTCQITATPTSAVTPAQRRTLMSILLGLADLGLVDCDETGVWRATGESLSDQDRSRAKKHHDPLRRAVVAERASYRASRGSTQWSTAHAGAVKAQRAKEAAWWAGLDAAQRGLRVATLSATFASLSFQQQLETKRRWAERGVRVGADPKRRHDDWLASQDPDVLARRSVARAADFAALPRPTQQAAVHAWNTYRREWGIPQPAGSHTAQPARVIRDESPQNDVVSHHLGSQAPSEDAVMLW